MLSHECAVRSKGAGEHRERATRPERAGAAARERACKGSPRGEAPRIRNVPRQEPLGSDGWNFRRGTLDRMIFDGVVVCNEYRLPSRFAPHDIVIDVGAHIGSFAYAVVTRGGQHVYSIEPDRANCACARENLKPYIEQGLRAADGRRRLAFRSERRRAPLRRVSSLPAIVRRPGGILNTGGGSVMWGAGDPVAKVALDDVIDLVTSHGERRVRLLKLDCEGAEWPALLTSRRLHLIDEIVGEFHEIGGPSWRSARIGCRTCRCSTPIASRTSPSTSSFASCRRRDSTSRTSGIGGPTARSKASGCFLPEQGRA